jgi:hypothetical protein
MMCKSYFSNYKSFTFVIFESNSKLQWIEEYSFK